MITREEENNHILAGIWLRSSIDAHDFIDPGYWHSNFPLMRDVYLSMTENYAYRETTGDPPLGFISLRENHIEALFVDPSFQGRGIGRRLLEYAQGSRKILTLNVYLKNSRSIKFYLANGFREMSRGTDDVTGEEEIFMQWP